MNTEFLNIIYKKNIDHDYSLTNLLVSENLMKFCKIDPANNKALSANERTCLQENGPLFWKLVDGTYDAVQTFHAENGRELPLSDKNKETSEE